jgi:hypothetical protein
MSNPLSDDEINALNSIQGHIEVPTARWQRLKRKIVMRTGLLVLVLLVRATAMILLPEEYLKSVFPFLDSSVNLADIAVIRLYSAAFFLGIYIYAVATNRYLRSASMLGVVVGVALLWSDVSQYFVWGWDLLSLESAISFSMRILTVALLILNYLDVRR